MGYRTQRGEEDQPRGQWVGSGWFSGFHRPYLVGVGFECCFECFDCVCESCDEFVCAWWFWGDECGVAVSDREGVDFVVGDVDWDVDGE